MDFRAELEEDRTIDPGQLEVECVRQADLYYKWAERAMEARYKATMLKHAADTLNSRLSLQAREKPLDFRLKVTTEGAIRAAVEVHKDYIAAIEAYYLAEHEAEKLGKAEVAMQMKKSMLTEMVKLHGNEYFAGPSVPRDIVSTWAEYQRRSEGASNDRQRGRARKRVTREDE